MIIRQIVLTQDHPTASWSKLANWFDTRGRLLGTGTLPDGRRFINARFFNELDVLAFMIGAGLIRIQPTTTKEADQ